MFNNNKSNITPLHKKLSTIVCIVVKTKNIKPVVFKTTILTMFNNNKSNITPLHKKIVNHCLYCTKNLSTIVCIVVKTKKYKASCFFKTTILTMFNNNKSIITPLHKKNCRPLSVLSLKLKI